LCPPCPGGVGGRPPFPSSLRIIHAGNFGTRAKGAALNSIAPKLSRGLIRAGHAVVDFADREVARAATPFGGRSLGVSAANRALTRLALDVRPDLLVLGHADMIKPATISDLRRAMPAMRVVQWNVDPISEARNMARLREKLPVVDATLVSTAGDALRTLKRAHMRLGFFPNPVDFSVETGTAHLHEKLPFDLFYACGHPSRPLRNLCGADWDMEAFVAALVPLVPGLRPRLAGMCGAVHLAGAPYQTALGKCAMGLNASRRNDFLLYSSDRLAQIVGSGQLALVQRTTGYDSLFSDSEIGFFGSLDELASLLRRMIAEPAARQAAAAAGRVRYHALFNETRVARYVVDVAFDTHNPADYEWPTLIA
jgi:Glycosyl transferases group 1